MRTTAVCRNHQYPEPPYTGGIHLVRLNDVHIWYSRLVASKGKVYLDNNWDELMGNIIPFVLGSEDEYSEEEVLEALHFDCLNPQEALYVKERLVKHIKDHILAMFPKLGAFIPRERYFIRGRELIIDVPKTYEEQLGYFF